MRKDAFLATFTMLVLTMQAGVGYCYYSIEEAYSSEAAINKPGITYDLSILASAKNVVWNEEGMLGIPNGFYLYKSHSYADLGVLVFETDIYGTEDKAVAVRLVPGMENKLVNKSNMGMANPSSVYCLEQGGQTGYAQTPEGTKGFCIVGNDTCEEWGYFYSSGANCTAPLGNETVVPSETPQFVEVEELAPTIDLTDEVMKKVMGEELTFLTQATVIKGLGSEDISAIREKVQVGLSGNNGRVVYENGSWISSLDSEIIAPMPRLMTAEDSGESVLWGAGASYSTASKEMADLEAQTLFEIPTGDVIITTISMGAPQDANNPLLQIGVLALAVGISFAIVMGLKRFKQ